MAIATTFNKESSSSIMLREMFGNISLESTAQIPLEAIREFSNTQMLEKVKERRETKHLGILAQTLLKDSLYYGQWLRQAVDNLEAATFLRNKFGRVQIAAAIVPFLNLLKNETIAKIDVRNIAEKEEHAAQELQTHLDQIKAIEGQKSEEATKEELMHQQALTDLRELEIDAPVEMSELFRRGETALLREIAISKKKGSGFDKKEVDETIQGVDDLVYETGAFSVMDVSPSELNPEEAIPMLPIALAA